MRSTEELQQTRNDRWYGSRASDRWWTVALLSTIALSFVVRVIALGSKSVFADELASFGFAQMSWQEFWRLITSREANMALYYVLLRFWIHIHASVAFLRFLSVIPAVATVLIVYLIGKKLFSRPVALLAALLFSLNTFHISYSQAARGYTLAVFLVALSCLYWIESLGDPTRANAIGYVIASAAAIYGHFFAIFVLVAQFVSLFALRRSRAAVVRQLLLMVLIGFLGIPLFFFAARYKTAPLFWVEPTSARGVYHFLTYLSGSGLKFAVSVVAMAIAAREWWWRRRLQQNTEPFMFLALWLLLPLGVTLLISLWKPVFSPRFLMISLPAFVLLVAEGLIMIRAAWASHLMAGVLLVSCVTALPAYYRQPGIEDWKSAIAYLHQHVQPSDSILINNPSYKDILQFSFREYGMDPPPRNLIAGRASEDLLRKSDRSWVVLCHAPASEEANIDALRTSFRSRETAQFVGIKIIEFDRKLP
jgi:mannosyltransferase